MLPGVVLLAVVFVGGTRGFPFFRDDRRYDADQRALTWSGWTPGGGMTLFTSGGWGGGGDFDVPPSELSPPPAVMGDWSDDGPAPPSSTSSRGSGSGNGPPPSSPSSDSPVGGAGSVGGSKPKPFDDDRDRHRPYKPWGKGHVHRNHHREEDDEGEAKFSGSNASVNAWFPIMLGVLPEVKDSKSGKSGTEPSADSQDSSSSPPRSISAIANSVNHARSGTASSHAILFTGEPPASFGRWRGH